MLINTSTNTLNTIMNTLNTSMNTRPIGTREYVRRSREPEAKRAMQPHDATWPTRRDCPALRMTSLDRGAGS